MKPITLFLVITASLIVAPFGFVVSCCVLHEITKVKKFDKDTPEWKRWTNRCGYYERMDDYGRTPTERGE